METINEIRREDGAAEGKTADDDAVVATNAESPDRQDEFADNTETADDDTVVG